MKVKSGFLTSEFLLILLAILLPVFDVLSAEEGALGVLAAVAYAFGRSWVKTQGAREEGETAITVEGIELEYDAEALKGLGQLLHSAFRNRTVQSDEDWAELVRVIIHRVQADIDEELGSGGRSGGAVG